MASTRETIVALDKRHVWHPYTPMAEYLESADPLVVERARGSRLYDVDGRSYIDANASWWTSLLGHNHPRLVAALKDQADRLCHTALAGITHEPAARLAEELCRVAPAGMNRVFFSDDGSTSIEVAVKLALQYWQQNAKPERRRFVALEGAFHGETLGATALSGVEVFRRPFASVVMECFHVPFHEHGYEESFAALSQLLRRESGSIAGVVLEPLVQGASGMRVYAPELLQMTRELTQELDVFLIADEVFTGYGRTGPMWACERAGVVPDLMCLAKGFSGGMLPMAATLVNDRIFDGFLGAAERAFFYGHTFCGNPLGAAVAREVLAVYRDERILEQARPKAQRIERAFAELAELPQVAGWRSLGMIGALDLAGAQGYLETRGRQVSEHARRAGVYLRPLGNVIYVAPALNIPDADLDELLGVVAEAVGALPA